MITYWELSSLTKDLGFSAQALYGLSCHLGSHYRKVEIPKGNEEVRKLYVPDEFLKAVQRRIAEKLLAHEPISPFATAYRFGGSTKANAAPHVGKPVLLKLDIRKFFDHVIYSQVKKMAFPAERYSEQNRILLSILCTYKDALPQGAPTSPAISNIILREFDDAVGQWCRKRDITYTRYCDDMSFSGDFEPGEVREFVKRELRKMGFFLNDQKTTVLRKGQKKIVTGIVVNEKLNVSVDYRRKLRQELYFCKKYGIQSHLNQRGLDFTEEQYVRKLLGRLNYIIQFKRDDKELLQDRVWLLSVLNRNGANKN